MKNEFNISYPKSLPEQQRIVAILDEAFAAIAQAKANAEQNLKNAKELFEHQCSLIFAYPGTNRAMSARIRSNKDIPVIIAF